MLKPIVNSQRQALMATLPAMLLIVSLITPLTVSCQRRQVDSERGTTELRALVEGAQGRPAANELSRIEAAFPHTRAAALARFLRGYLYYSAQNYQSAIDAL